MYVGIGKRASRLAGSHRLSGLRGLRGRGLGQDVPIDWGSIISTGITTAGAVAVKAVAPPTYSSVVNPITGAQTITSYAPIGATSSLLGTSSLGTEFSSLLSSPLVLLGGIALIAVFALKR
jgi:hypothetical protein